MPELAARKRDGGRRELIVRWVIADGGGRSRVTHRRRTRHRTKPRQNRRVACPGLVDSTSNRPAAPRRESHLASHSSINCYANLDDELSSYRERYARAEEIRTRLHELSRRERERADLLELARFRTNELERAGLVAGEDEALAQERTVLANASKLASAALETEQALCMSADAARRPIRYRAPRRAWSMRLRWIQNLGDALEMIKSARANPEEAARSLHRGAYASKIERDPDAARGNRQPPAGADAAQAQVRRLQSIPRSKRWTDRAPRLASWKESASRKRRSEAAMASAVDEPRRACKQTFPLPAMRRRRPRPQDGSRIKIAWASARWVSSHGLCVLVPDDAGFKHAGIALGPFGIDTIEFHLSPNVGQPAMPLLLRIGVGGEPSRVMLCAQAARVHNAAASPP